MLHGINCNLLWYVKEASNTRPLQRYLFYGCSQSLVRKFLGIRTPARILIFTDPYPKICRPVVVRKKSFITGCRNRNTHGLEISLIVRKSDRFAPGPQKMRSQKLLIPSLFLCPFKWILASTGQMELSLLRPPAQRRCDYLGLVVLINFFSFILLLCGSGQRLRG